MAATRAEALCARQGVPVRVRSYEHDEAATNFGAEAVAKTGLGADRVFKTLVVDSGGALAFALVPVAARLDLRAVARELGAKKARLADRTVAERATGYVMGGITALASRSALACLVDSSAAAEPSFVVSAGARGRNLELAYADFARLTGARLAAIATAR